MAITAKEEIRGSVSGAYEEKINGSLNGSGLLGGKSDKTIFYTDAYNIALANGFVGSIEDWLESLKGKDGYTPVKGVDYFDGSPGKDGADGQPGKDGYTPIKGVDYFDGQDGQPGKNGSPGKDGADGYSPVRGKDYWTDDDKAAMVSDVIAALPIYNGEVVAV